MQFSVFVGKFQTLMIVQNHHRCKTVRIWSPLLVGLAFDLIMKVAFDKHKRGLTLVPKRSSRYPEAELADLDYADDITLFEETDVEMAKTTEAIRAIAWKLGF